MIRLALAVSLGLYLGMTCWVAKECMFLAEYRYIIWGNYAESILGFALLVFLNLFAAAYCVIRKVSLVHTGDKLSHVEKQLRGRTSISAELSERIMQRK